MNYKALSKFLEGFNLPQAVIDLEAFQKNLNKVTYLVKQEGRGLKVRIATKSLRVPELFRMALARSDIFQGLMCFSAQEAKFLASEGFDDLLVAYPSIQSDDLRALREIHESGKKTYLMIDCPSHIETIDRSMSGLTEKFPVVIDVDLSLRFLNKLHIGVQRSPIRDMISFEKVLELIQSSKNLRFAGVMGYEAQLAGLGDRNPFKKFLNPIFQMIRWISKKYVRKRRKEISDYLKNREISCEIFNGGGSGSLNFSMKEPWLSEVTIGSGLVCSHLFDYYSNIQFEPALYFAIASTRNPEKSILTGLGGGYIASGEPGWDKVPKLVYPKGKLIPTEGCGEVQTPVVLDQKHEIGHPLIFRHAKSGELAERFKEYRVFDSDQETVYRTYRGLGQTFL